MDDMWGYPVSGGDPAVRAAADRFAGALVAYRVDILSILDAAGAFPGHPLIQAYAGILHLLAEQQGAEEKARPFLARARAALAVHAASASADARETAIVDALAAWIGGDIDGTVAILDRVVGRFPRDLAAAKLLQYHHFNRGDFPGMLRAVLPALSAAPDAPYLHGMAAFAYEQLHLLDKAERAARRALALRPDDPWAQHALAHVLLTQGRGDEGIVFLERAAAGWTGLNSFMLTHLWWHLALFYLGAGRFGDALSLYDGRVWGVDKSYSQDQVGAVSLLILMELAGIDAGTRWEELSGWLAARAGDVVQPFLSVQYLYGLARAGRAEADQLLAAIAAAAGDGVRQDRAIWREAALPLARGLLAHARRDHAAAADAITAALPHILRLGGSHAQRDLFEQLLLDADVRAGRLIEAQQALELRRSHDPDNVPVNARLAEVYRALGLDEEAGAARRRVERRTGR